MYVLMTQLHFLLWQWQFLCFSVNCSNFEGKLDLLLPGLFKKNDERNALTMPSNIRFRYLNGCTWNYFLLSSSEYNLTPSFKVPRLCSRSCCISGTLALLSIFSQKETGIRSFRISLTFLFILLSRFFLWCFIVRTDVFIMRTHFNQVQRSR